MYLISMIPTLLQTFQKCPRFQCRSGEGDREGKWTTSRNVFGMNETKVIHYTSTKQPETQKKKFSTLKHSHFSKISSTSLNMNKIPTGKICSSERKIPNVFPGKKFFCFSPSAFVLQMLSACLMKHKWWRKFYIVIKRLLRKLKCISPSTNALSSL